MNFSIVSQLFTKRSCTFWVLHEPLFYSYALPTFLSVAFPTLWATLLSIFSYLEKIGRHTPQNQLSTRRIFDFQPSGPSGLYQFFDNSDRLSKQKIENQRKKILKKNLFWAKIDIFRKRFVFFKVSLP